MSWAGVPEASGATLSEGGMSWAGTGVAFCEPLDAIWPQKGEGNLLKPRLGPESWPQFLSGRPNLSEILTIVPIWNEPGGMRVATSPSSMGGKPVD